MKSLVVCLLLLASPALAQVGCTGQDLVAAMTPEEKSALDAEVAKAPYPAGNHWAATKDGQVIHVIGTFHLYDARMDPVVQRLASVIRAADKLYVEATDAEMEQLKKDMSTRPELILSTGPTLPEQLTKEEWADLSAAMSARGIPPFMASKFRPWYVSMLISIPPCAMAAMGAGARGLDHLVIEEAKAAGKPVAALETYDTAIRLFEDMGGEDQLDMIRAALPLVPQSDDIFATMTASYFREENRQIWEFGRLKTLELAGDRRDKMAADYDKMDATLLKGRNAAWMEKLLADDAASLVVAVGAGHLAGEHGLLKLLEEAGYSLERQPF